MKPWILALPLVLAACGDKDVVDTADTTASNDSGAIDTDETYPDTSPSSYTTGTYRVGAFALVTDATVGFDIDGDGEVNNKLPSVLNLAAGLTGEPLSPGEINKTLASDLKKGNIVLLTEGEQANNLLRLDVLFGTTDKKGAVSIDPLSYNDSGEPNSSFSGVFSTETDYEVSADLAELPFTLISGADPVLIPLELVVMSGSIDDASHSGMLGGAVPTEAFVDDVIESIIPTGDDYDKADYLDMTREELIEFIRDFANQDGVADITLEDGRKAVSAVVEFSASADTWE